MKKLRTYAGIPEKLASKEIAQIYLQSIAYDGTSTWGKGADRAFEAFLEASENMELYDIETGTEVYHKGVFMPSEMGEFKSPQDMVDQVYTRVKELLTSLKFLTFLGGEHSVSIPILRAYRERYPQLSVLQLDAHTDLRPSYEGTAYNHACALYESSKESNLVQVGIRSMDSSEIEHLCQEKVYWAHDIHDQSDWMQDSIDQLTDDVYITLDLDVLDPSIMPATGTPEPGGLSWYQIVSYLRRVFEERNVVGFDIVELAPIENITAPNFLVAKLYYKMLTYKFLTS